MASYLTHKTVLNILQVLGTKCLSDGHNKPVYLLPPVLAMINAAPSLADVDCGANSRSREQRPAHPATLHCTGHCVHSGGTEFVCVDNINIPCVYLDNIHTLEHFLNFLTIQLSGVCGRCQFLDKYVLKICQFFRTIRVNTHKQNVRLQKYLNKKISDHGWTEVKFSVVICTKSP